MNPDPKCSTCGHTGEDRRYFSYESWSVGTCFACNCCIEAHTMATQSRLQTIPAEDNTKGR